MNQLTHYADSSFLVSCYMLDANTSAARTYLSGASQVLPFTPLHALEVGNAFELAVFRGMVKISDAETARANLEQDFAMGVC